MDSSNEIKAIREALERLFDAADSLQRRVAALEGDQDDAAGEHLFSDPDAFAASDGATPIGVEMPPVRKPPPPLPPSQVTPTETVKEKSRAKVFAEAAAEKTAGTKTDALAGAPVVAPVRPEIPLSPTVGEQIRKILKKIGPKEEMSWEMALGTYWMPRIAIAVLTIGVVLLMTLAVQKFGGSRWVPHLRIALGYGICVTLLAFGKRLEHTATNYARVLLSGGLATSYFVTFSMHFVPYTRIIPSRTVGLALLAVVVIAWGTVAQLRRSIFIAFAVTVLGHLTILLSTFTLDTPPRFGIVGVVLLSAVSAFFLLKNRWYYVAAAGMVGSYLNHFLWLYKSPGSEAVVDFATSMAILATYYLIFALAELYAPEGLRRRVISTRMRTLYTGFNTTCFFGLGLLVMKAFSFSRDLTYLFYFAFSAVLLGIACGYWARRKADPLYNAYFAKGTAVMTLGFAAYFDGATLTATLAVESVVLLLGAGRRGHVTSRILALSVALVTVAHGLYTIATTNFVPYAAPQYWPALISAALAAAALFGASHLYQRTDWILRTPRTAPFSKDNRKLLWQLDLIVEAPDENAQKPLAGLLVPYAYAVGAVILIIGYSIDLTSIAHRGPALMLIALALTPIGLYLRSTPLRIASVPIALFATLAWHGSLLRQGTFDYADTDYLAFLAYGLTTLIPLLILSELSRLACSSTLKDFAIPADNEAERDRSTWLSFAYALVAVEAIVAANIFFVQTSDRCMALGLVALAFTLYSWRLGARPIGLSAMILVAVAIPFGVAEFNQSYIASRAFIAVAALAGTAFFSEQQYLGQRPGLRFHQESRAPYFLYGVVVLLGGLALSQHFTNPLLGTQAMVVAAGGITILALKLHPKAMGVFGALLLLWATARWLGDDDMSDTRLWHCVAWSLAVFALAGDRFHAHYKRFPRDWVGAALVVLSCGIFFAYAHELARPNWHQSFWVITALAFIVYGAAFKSHAALAIGTVGAVMATASHTSHSYENALPLTPLVSTYLALVTFWALAERGFARVANRFTLSIGDRERAQLTHFLVAVPCILLVVMLERIPLLSDFYLTISWTIAALCMFAFALLIQQYRYRYAGLITFALALARVIVVDTRNLEAMFRIAAFIFLGAVMLAVGYAYIRARARIAQSTDNAEEPTTPEKETSNPATKE